MARLALRRGGLGGGRRAPASTATTIAPSSTAASATASKTSTWATSETAATAAASSESARSETSQASISRPVKASRSSGVGVQASVSPSSASAESTM